MHNIMLIIHPMVSLCFNLSHEFDETFIGYPSITPEAAEILTNSQRELTRIGAA